MTSIKIVYRPSARQGRYPGSLVLRLIHNRRVKNITLAGCKLYGEEWDGESQRIVYPAGDSQRTAYLEKTELTIAREMQLLENHLSVLEKQGRYTADELAGMYCRHKDNGKILGYGERLAFELEQRGQLRTARAYRTVTRGLVEFSKGKDIPLAHINNKLIKDFETYLKDKGRLPNTISYYMRNLRAIYNKAVAGKRIVCRGGNPFAGVCTGVTKTMKRALSPGELKKIRNLDFSALLKEKKSGTKEHIRLKKVEAARRYFSFCFYARGMCFIDLAHLKKDNIRGGFIRYVRKKTGRQIEIRITREMQEIIDSFAEETKASPYVFPLLKSNKKNIRLQYETALKMQNLYLKEIASLAKVDKPVSTHWARHSWATVGKQENIPLRVISECLGHTSEKTTLIYLGLLDNSVLDAANEAVASAIMRQQTA